MDKIEFSDQIKELLKETWPDKDIYNMSLDELKAFREECVNKKNEYNMLQLGIKLIGNAAYGAAANRFCYFFDPKLPGDITGECRLTTKRMIAKIENFFHEEIWDRNDLKEKFNFELDESKHDWYRTRPLWVYSDTDSVAGNSLLLIDNKEKISIEELFNKSLKENGLMDRTISNQEIVKCNASVLNWTSDNKIKNVPIKYIMRHKVSKPKFKIKTKSGKEIILTGDHSCIVFRNGKQLTIKAKDINIKTDKILSINE